MERYEYSREVRDRARDMWVSGEATMSTIARTLGVARVTLYEWRKEDDWRGIRNLSEQDAYNRIVRDLADQTEKVNKNYFQLYAAIMEQVFKTIKTYTDAGKPVPSMEQLVLARVLRLCQEGHDAVLGRDPKWEARQAVDKAPRRVLVEYEPLSVTLRDALDAEEAENGNGNGNGNGES